ncbi:MAG: PEP-CTERM sorting domain-containing protein [Planctomycetota bacterium]|nr:PEP-CTERM sorting domain-containing protein [Planctomycetota bacterium]
MRALKLGLLCVTVLVATVAQVQAGIINGGFETGDLTGWSTSGADFADTSTVTPHTGNFSFRGYDNSGFATLSQSFSTLPAAVYQLDFWSFTSVSDPGNILRYQIDADPIITVLQTPFYALTTDSFTASGATTTLSFYFETDPGTGTRFIDDVSVTQLSAVPEPSTVVLLLTGGVSLIGYGWRRKKKLAA